MSKEKNPKNFEDGIKKKVLKNGLALVSQFLPENELIKAEQSAIEGLKKYFTENEGTYFFISPVVENDSLNAILGILKENPDGSIVFLKQLPIKIDDNELESIPIKELINSILRSKIDLFNLFKNLNKKEL